MSGKGIPIGYHLYQWFWVGIDLLFPPNCAGCQIPGVNWCKDCQSKTLTITNPVCDTCGAPQKSKGVCTECKIDKPAFDKIISFAKYEEPFRKAVIHLKYHGDGGLGEALSFPLIYLLQNLGWKFDLVIPVPLGRARRKKRGYNQTAFVALPLCRYFGLPYRPKALQRVRETRSQVGLTGEERRGNVSGAFSAEQEIVDGKVVLLVDDVFTTGATMNACAKTLKSSGAEQVFGITLARAVGRPKEIWELT